MNITFFIKTLSGKTLSLTNAPGDTVLLIKKKIEKDESVPVNVQKLIYNGKELDDEKTLAECGVLKESVLNLVLKKSESHMNRLTAVEQKELIAAQSESASRYYSSAVGLNDELETYTDSESKFDVYQNPQGEGYDLGKDGEFSEFVVLIGQFYSFDIANAKKALEKKGFVVILTTETKFFLDALPKADIAIIISGASNTGSKDFAQKVAEFHKAGGALYIWGDNGPYVKHANEVLPLVLNDSKVQLSEDYTHAQKILSLGNALTKGQFGPHIITTGIVKLYEGHTICYPNSLGPLKVLATSSDGHPAVCYADNESLRDMACGRVIVDCGFTKLYLQWDDAGTARYIMNAAVWLLGIEHKILHQIPIAGKNKRTTTTTSSSNNNSSKVKTWSVEDVFSWMSLNDQLKPHAATFKEQDIDGSMLHSLSAADLKELSIDTPEKQQIFKDLVQKE